MEETTATTTTFNSSNPDVEGIVPFYKTTDIPPSSTLSSVGSSLFVVAALQPSKKIFMASEDVAFLYNVVDHVGNISVTRLTSPKSKKVKQLWFKSIPFCVGVLNTQRRFMPTIWFSEGGLYLLLMGCTGLACIARCSGLMTTTSASCGRIRGVTTVLNFLSSTVTKFEFQSTGAPGVNPDLMPLLLPPDLMCCLDQMKLSSMPFALPACCSAPPSNGFGPATPSAFADGCA